MGPPLWPTHFIKSSVSEAWLVPFSASAGRTHSERSGSFRTQFHALWFTKRKSDILRQWHLLLRQFRRQKAICHSPRIQPSHADGNVKEKEGNWYEGGSRGLTTAPAFKTHRHWGKTYIFLLLVDSWGMQFFYFSKLREIWEVKVKCKRWFFVNCMGSHLLVNMPATQARAPGLCLGTWQPPKWDGLPEGHLSSALEGPSAAILWEDKCHYWHYFSHWPGNNTIGETQHSPPFTPHGQGMWVKQA